MTDDASTRIDPHADEPISTAGAPPAATTAAVVLLHGRGSSPDAVLRLADEFHHRGVLYVAPKSSGSVWYPGGVDAPVESRRAYLDSAFARVDTALDIAAETGVSPKRCVLFGFSQGGCLAAEYAARQPKRYGGLAVLAGGLLGPTDAFETLDRFDAEKGSLDGTPIFLGCGDDDPHVTPGRIDASADVFCRLGGDVTTRLYEGLGHYINDDQMHAVDEMVASVAGPPS
ncbi:alpha/beta hydrolase [Haloprofundus salilacus]|uniref:alpha/beta hydrolase n=1 Tax=Haloprofundus salilacus TaxID=2876190 RepID=UPI001CCE718D|nr:alpha/beta hydrolase [Haloprofundus salilacus]